MECKDWRAWYDKMPGSEDPNLYVAGSVGLPSSAARTWLEVHNVGVVPDPALAAFLLKVEVPDPADTQYVWKDVSWSGNLGPDIKNVRIQGECSAEIPVEIIDGDGTSGGASSVFVRKAVSSAAAAADLAVYAEGVRLMKARSAANQMDPLGWFYQSRMHGNPMALPRQPTEPQDWSECQHGTWFFLPWHRMYLLQFERIIRELTGEPGFCLPYWDYPSASNITIPQAFLDTNSPLFDGTRDFDQPTVAPETWQNQVSFGLFGGGVSQAPVHRGQSPGLLEGNPHNPVHGAVDGNMATFQSPLDPLFWIHHCNIDRLWERWLQLPGRLNPDSASWSDTTFEFPDPVDGRRTIRVGDVATTALAGYEYDDTAAAGGEEGLEMPTDRRRDDQLELLGAAEGGSVADQRELRLEPSAVGDRFKPGLETVPPPLFLRLENTGLSGGDAGQMWNVLVRVAGDEWQLAGTIAPFGLGGLTESGGRQTLTFDISHLSSRLLVEGAAPIEVKFEPARSGVTAEPFFERIAVYTTPE